MYIEVYVNKINKLTSSAAAAVAITIL